MSDISQCLHIKNLVQSFGPKVKFVQFYISPGGFGKVLCSSANEFQQNSNSIYSTNIDCFVIDSSCLHLTCLSFVTNSWNHLKYNYSIVQSASWPDRFYIIIMEVFVAESQNFLLAKCPPAAMSKEKCVCLQASGEIEQLRGLFGFILLLFAMNESWVIRTKLTPVSRVSQAHAPPPPRKLLKSGSLRIHFQHSGAKIKSFWTEHRHH